MYQSNKGLWVSSSLAGIGRASLAVAMTAFSSAALANPIDGNVVAGSVTFEETGKKLDIYQSSDKAVIDWRKFDIEADEHTQFYQPGSNSIAINRVKDHNPSRIMGKLTANGNVVIINPNGILFGKSAKVDLNGLVATTSDIDTGKFMSGEMKFNKPGNPDAEIINEGEISAKDAGLVGLVAPNVENRGTINARLGKVKLASADEFTLDLYGDGLVEVKVSDDVKSQLVRNTGSINADGGIIELSAAAGKKVVNSLVDAGGSLKARSISRKNGKIIIGGSVSNGGMVKVSGRLDASGYASGEKGGEVKVTGDQVGILNGSVIDVSGDQGGGNIKIGGDFQGKGETPTARVTYVAKDANIKADAITKGDGGEVIIWADNTTRYYGGISSTGGKLGGNGGFVEVSGKKYLDFSGNVNLRGDINGTLLLDPDAIEVVAGTANPAELSDNSVNFAENSGSTTTIGADTISSKLSANTNVILQANNSIVVNSNITSTGDGNLTLETGASGVITINNAIVMNTGDITMISDDIAVNANITGTTGSLAVLRNAGDNDQMYVGGSGGGWNLSNTEMAKLTGFDLLTIGSSSQTANINFTGSVSLSNATSFITGSTGDIVLNLGGGTIAASTNKNLTFNSGRDITTSSTGKITTNRTSTTGVLSMTASNDIKFDNSIDFELMGTQSGIIQNIVATNGNININAPLTFKAGTLYYSDIYLKAGKNVNIDATISKPSGATDTHMLYFVSGTGGTGDINVNKNISGGFRHNFNPSGATSYANFGEVTLTTPGQVDLYKGKINGNVTMVTDYLGTTGALYLGADLALTGRGDFNGVITTSGNRTISTSSSNAAHYLVFRHTINGTAGGENLVLNASKGYINVLNKIGDLKAFGNLSIIADNIGLSNTINGTGVLTLSNTTAGKTIGVNNNSGSDILIDTTEWGKISSSWSGLVIGSSNAGALTSNVTSWSGDLTLKSNSTITLATDLTLAADKSLVLNSAGGNITGSNVKLNTSRTGTGGNITVTAAGNIDFSTVNLITGNGNVDLTATGNASLSAINAGSGNLNVSAYDITLTAPTGINPLAWWNFNEGSGSTLLDVSGNGNSGTILSAPVYSTFTYNNTGYSLLFDGVDDYVNTGLTPNTELGSSYTITGWVYSSAGGNYRGVAGAHYNGGIGVVFGQYENGSMGFGYGSNSWGHGVSAATELNSWKNYTMVVNGGVSVQLYVDGVLVGTDVDTALTTHGPDFWIGRAYNESTRYFQGYIDDLKVYNTNLNSQQVSSLYSTGSLPTVAWNVGTTNINATRDLTMNLNGSGITLGSNKNINITAGNSITSSSAGSITLNGGTTSLTGSTVALGTNFTNNGNLKIRSDTLTGTPLGNGSGTFTFEQSTAANTIGIGTGGTHNTSLSDSLVSAIKTGWGNYIFGRSDGGALTHYTSSWTGDLTLKSNDDITFANAVAIGGNLTADAGDDVLVNGAITRNSSSDATVNLKAKDGVEVAANITGSGTGKLNIILNSNTDETSGGYILVSNGAGITSNNGSITLGGGSTPTTKNAEGNSTQTHGVYFNNGSLFSGTGTIIVNGKAADTSSNMAGVTLKSGSVINSTSGNITVTGYGGSGNGDYVAGVALSSTGTNKIYSTSGNITVTGTGSTGLGFNNYGVHIAGTSSSIESGGDLTISGTGGGKNTGYGVYLNGANSSAVKALSTAKLTISGQGSSYSNGNSNYGLYVAGGAGISSASGKIDITGIGGTGDNGANVGIYLDSGSNRISSTSGAIKLTATGGSNSVGLSNYGLYMNTSSSIEGTSTIEIVGQGGGAEMGVAAYIQGGAIKATSSGTIDINATATIGTAGNNYGIYLTSNTTLSTVSGTLTLLGAGGKNSNSRGIFMDTGTNKISSTSGAIKVTGTSGSSTGVYINGGTNSIETAGNIDISGQGLAKGVRIGGTVRSTGTGNITIDGKISGGGGGSNYGSHFIDGALISTNSGKIEISGTGGGNASGNNFGIYLETSGNKITSSSGTIKLTGNGGSVVTGTNNHGIYLASGTSIEGTSTVDLIGTGTGSDGQGIRLEGGTVKATGTGVVNLTGLTTSGTGADIATYTGTASAKSNIIAYGVNVNANTISVSTGSLALSALTGGTVTILPRTDGTAINVGDTSGGLFLTSELMGSISADNLIIGNSKSGALTSKLSSYSGNLTYLSDGAITISSALTMGAGNFTATTDDNIAINAALTGASGKDVTLTSSTIALAADLSGTGNLTLQPYSSTTTIRINSGTSDYNLTTSEVAKIKNGWSNIYLGNSSYTNDIVINASDWYDPVTFRNSTNSIYLAGAINGYDNASITLTGGSARFTNATVSAVGDVNITSAPFIRITTGNETVSSSAGNVNFNSNLYLSDGGTLNAYAPLGTVKFSSVVRNSVTPGTQDITLNISGKSIDFSGVDFGTSSSYLGNVSFTTADNLLLNTIYAKNLTATVTGAGNKITTGGTVNVSNDISLIADDLDIAHNLTGSGTVTLSPYANSRAVNVNNGSAGFNISTAELGKLVSGWSNVVIGKGTNTASFNIGTTSWDKSISFLNNGNMYLLANADLTSTNGASITFTADDLNFASGSKVVSAGDVTLNADTLWASSTGKIDAAGNITFTDALDLGEAATFIAGGTITLDKVNYHNAAKSLTATAGAFVFNGLLGDSLYALGDVTITSTSNITLPEIYTSKLSVTTNSAGKKITTGGNINVAGNLTFTSDDVEIGHDLAGSGNIYLKEYSDFSTIRVNSGAGGYNIDSTEIGKIQNGWGNIYIGSTSAIASNMYVGTSNWQDNVIFRSNSGVISLSGNIAADADSSINFVPTGTHGRVDIASGTSISAGKNVTFEKYTQVLGGSASVNSSSGNVAFTGFDLSNTIQLLLSGNLSITAANGDVSFAKTIRGTRNLSVDANSITFTDAQLGVDSGYEMGNVSLKSATSLILPEIYANGTIIAQTTGAGSDITLGADLLGSASGDAIILAAAGDFLNIDDKSVYAPNGRWLIYSNSHEDIDKGGLTEDFRRYSCTYGGACPTVSSVPGNAFLYASTPVLDVIIDDKTRAYGDNDPTFTYQVSGYLSGDNGNDTIGGSLTLGTSATTTSNIGDYDITKSGSLTSAMGYGFNYINGNLEVTKRDAVVNASDIVKTYGDADPSFTGSNDLLAYDLNLIDLIYTPVNYTGDAGVYNIGVAATTNLERLDNYNIIYNSGTLTVNKRDASINIADKSKTYGDADPTYSSTNTLLNGDASQLSWVYNVAGYSGNAGIYDITASASGNTAVLDNYNLTFDNGTLTVSKRDASVNIADKSKTYGDTDPTYSSTNTLLSGDASQLSWVYNVAGYSGNAGIYDITASASGNTAVLDNYNLTFDNGTLTVSKREASVNIADKSKTYGDADPTYSSTNTLLSGDANQLSWVYNVAGYSGNAGIYDITASASGNTAVLDNYNITYDNGTLTVDKRNANIAVANKNKTYGAADPSYSLTHNLIGADASQLSWAYNVSGYSGNAGTYNISATAVGNTSVLNNYNVSYTNGTLTVGKANLSISANNASKQQGQANPALSASFNGFVNGDNSSVFTSPLVIGTAALTSSPVGTYTINVSGAAAANYNISFNPGVLTVTNATRTVPENLTAQVTNPVMLSRTIFEDEKASNIISQSKSYSLNFFEFLKSLLSKNSASDEEDYSSLQ